MARPFATLQLSTECGLVHNGETFIDNIRHGIKKYSMSANSHSIPVITSGFRKNAALMGSFSLILEKILLLEDTRN
ncbi:MAG TPA: hypothetical protein VMV47_04060 [Bacteroidales bacterium]|nr:hypothetical protein [Bacteroidales bacterium]